MAACSSAKVSVTAEKTYTKFPWKLLAWGFKVFFSYKTCFGVMLHSSVFLTDRSGFIGPSWKNLAGDSSGCIQKRTCRRKLQCFYKIMALIFLFSPMKTKHSCIYYPYYLETKWPVLFLFCIVSFSWISLVLYGCPHTFVHKSITKFPFQVYTILKILCSLLIFLIQQGFIFYRREIWVSCSVLLLFFLCAFC